jgi:hypothetical protein
VLTNQRSPVSRVSSETSFRSKLFWTMGREYAWILGEGTPFGGRGPRAPQRGMISISWVWTGEERRRSKMTKDKEDSSITASRSDYAQSKCHCASGSSSVRYPLWELWFIVLLFQENKSFGASYHLHSSYDVREAVSGTETTETGTETSFGTIRNKNVCSVILL